MTSPCVVRELTNNFFVYPIFKNASSSIQKHQEENKFRFFENTAIKGLPIITIYLRDPEERIWSGLQTFLQRNRNFEKIEKIKNYTFVDSHFMPQYFWMLHLVKYYKGSVCLKPFSELKKLLQHKINESTGEKIKHDIYLKKYIELDQTIIEKYMNTTIHLPKLIDEFYGLSKA